MVHNNTQGIMWKFILVEHEKENFKELQNNHLNILHNINAEILFVTKNKNVSK